MKKPPCMVWLPVDHRLLGDDGQKKPFLVLGDKYARAVKQGAMAQPVLFPLAEVSQISELLDLVDGVMLTGSPSNVHPSHFEEAVADPELPLDPQRDVLTLALVSACVKQRVPLLGVCRGFQEINVTLGGSLHQQALGHATDGLVEAFGARVHKLLHMPFNGTLSGVTRKGRFTLPFFGLLGKPAASGKMTVWPKPVSKLRIAAGRNR